MPLHLTAKERQTLATLLILLILGFLGMAVLREDPSRRASAAPSPQANQPRP